MGIISAKRLTKAPKGYKIVVSNIIVFCGGAMKVISEFIKQNRKALGLTQEEFAMRAGLGLRFVRELEQGKKTLRLDKVNQALAVFGAQVSVGRLNSDE